MEVKLKPAEYSRERAKIRASIAANAPRYITSILGRAKIGPDTMKEFVSLGGSLWEQVTPEIKAALLKQLRKDTKTVQIIKGMDDIPQIIYESLGRTKYGEAVTLEWLRSEFEKFKAELGE